MLEVFSRAPGREPLPFDQAGSEGGQLMWLQVETFILHILYKIFHQKNQKAYRCIQTFKALFTLDFEQPQKTT